MKNKNVRGIIALVLVTGLSFGVILGSRALSHNIGAGTESGAAKQEAAVLEELDTTGAENIEKAVKTEDGYTVTVRTRGYAGDILMAVSFDAEAKKVTKAEVLEQGETEGVGSRITEAEFLSQFEGVAAPVYLSGMTAEAGKDSSSDTAALADKETAAETEKPNGAGEAAALKDGTYTAKTQEPDSSGFIEELTMTVADGKITEVVWDCVDAEGNRKSVLSENGQYMMTEDGPTWKEQAESLAAALVEAQNLAALGMKEDGKTDAVSGVSINIMSFVTLAEECMEQAAVKAVLNDGTYMAKTKEADNSGYIGELTMTVAEGKITEVVWDYVDAEGNRKSVQSENGEYVMTEDGPTWKEQAESLAAALVEAQDLAALGMKEDGKTDAVSGVSINIMEFVALAEQCLEQAFGAEAEETAAVEEAVTEEAVTEEAATEEAVTEEAATEEVITVEAGTEAGSEAAPADGTLVDGVSGATVSSTAAVKGINDAYHFLQTVK